MDLVHPEPELLDHLVVEFGDHGRRAVEFIATAEQLLRHDGDADVPRLPETITYCLREAMKTIPASQDVKGGGLWRSASRAVTEARRRFERARGVPGEDEQGALDALLAAIEDFELVHSQEGIHERRLIAIMVGRTGTLPAAAGTAPIRAYHELLVELDQAMHGETTLDSARAFWNRCVGILRQLFLPPDIRHAELEALATVERPQPEDVQRLLPLIAGPNHLRHFLGRLVSPAWLDALSDTGMLDPPAENGPWPAFAAVDRLAGSHARAVVEWLNRMYDRHRRDPTRSWFIARAAVDVGADGAPLVVRAVRDHASVAAISSLGVWAAEKVEPSSDLIESLADVLLNEASLHSAAYVDPLIERFIDGLDGANAGRRLQLLCWKLSAVDEDGRGWLRYDSSGSIVDSTDDDGRGDRFTLLLRAVVEAGRRAAAWLSVDQLLSALDSLPGELRGRLRAWVLSTAADVDVDRVVQELANAISERRPTGDDLSLLDRVVTEADPAVYGDLWMRQLGPAPAVVDVAEALAARDLPEEWLRAYRWAALLPEQAIGDWAQPLSIIAAAYGTPTRETLTKRQRVEGGWGRSPMTADELAAMTPVEASRAVSAWRPDPSDWLVSARELARTLEGVVKANPGPWLATPLHIVTELRHPTYIHHYLRGAADALKGVETPVGELLNVLRLVRAHPWDAEPLGSDRFDFDPDWRGAEQASVDILKALADGDVGFSGRDEEVWTILEAEVRDRTARSSLVSGARDPLDSAINRPCTRALEAVLSCVAYQFRVHESISPRALELLEDCLRIDGTDGAEHRAILATRLGLLRYVAPEWVDRVADLLFGPEAPEGLAQVTADLAVKWSQPNRWLLERYRSLVRDAVVRGVENALDHLLIAMLWHVPGYAPEENLAFLQQYPSLLSKAGEILGRLLRHGDPGDEHIGTALEFWDAAIATKKREGLGGFGWMTEVKRLDDTKWAERTLRTLAVTRGRLDWSHKVAERAGTLPPSPTTLAIMNHLIRGASDEWDRRGNIERAVALLKAASALAGTRSASASAPRSSSGTPSNFATPHERVTPAPTDDLAPTNSPYGHPRNRRGPQRTCASRPAGRDGGGRSTDIAALQTARRT